jgi:hypothetical protein
LHRAATDALHETSRWRGTQPWHAPPRSDAAVGPASPGSPAR